MPVSSLAKQARCRIPFRLLFQPLAADTTGFTGTYLDLALSNISERLDTIQSYYRRWRFSRPLRVQQFVDQQGVTSQYYNTAASASNSSGVGITHAVGFYMANEATTSSAPTSNDAIVELQVSRCDSAARPLRMDIPVKTLMSALNSPWAYTAGGTLSSGSNVIGSLWFGIDISSGSAPLYSAYSAGVWVSLTGEVEFSGPTWGGGVPLARVFPKIRASGSYRVVEEKDPSADAPSKEHQMNVNYPPGLVGQVEPHVALALAPPNKPGGSFSIIRRRD